MQHFYLGLRQSSAQFLDLASEGAFLHLPISEGRVVLATILDNTLFTDDHSDAPKEDQAPRDETSSADATVATSQVVELEPQSQTPLREEVIHPLEYPLNIETDLFADYGNVSKQPVQKRNHNAPKEQVSSRLEVCYLKTTPQELMTIMSSEWLKESEASCDVIRLLSCFTTIRCLISRTPKDSLYDLDVGASVMSKNLALTLLGEELLVLTEKFLKLPSRELVESYGLAQNVSVVISKVHILLNFNISDVKDIDLLIGNPLMRFIDGFHSWHLKG